MIEKKVGNVTLKLEDKYIAVFIGSMPVRNVWHTDPIPDFGPEITAAIEDLRKPLAGNEGWLYGERVKFTLRDSDGAGFAETEESEWVESGYAHSAGCYDDESDSDPEGRLEIWAEKERARWGTMRKRDAVHVTLDGKLDCYGFVDAGGWNAADNSGNVPEWFKNKTWAEYEAMVREKKQEWTCGKWNPIVECVAVTYGSTHCILKHEDEIERDIPEAPEEVKLYARAQIVANRQVAGDGCETRIKNILWRARPDGAVAVVQFQSTSIGWIKPSAPELKSFRDAYLAKLKPKKPSERLDAVRNTPPGSYELTRTIGAILDELAEKVGGL